MVGHDVIPTWSQPLERLRRPPANHGSARQALNVIVKNLRKGQDANHYLVLDVDLPDQLDDVTCSPFGAVQKGDIPLAEDARVIHDLSYPPGDSVNDHTEAGSTIDIFYDRAWFTRWQALGLCWDLHQVTVSIPDNKIAKAEGRLLAIPAAQTTMRKALNELLGSLRQVCTCVRSATAFVQSIGDLCCSASRSRRVIISKAAHDDVRWFLVVLRTARLNSIPLSQFAALQPPDWHIFMDASDRGLCALFPGWGEYLQVEFTVDEQARIRALNRQGTSAFGINLRELLSATFASIVWVDANAAQLGDFAVYLWQWAMNHRGRGNTCLTVCAKLSAVRWYHRSNLGYDPGVNAGHALLLKGIRRFTSLVLKQPIAVAILCSVHARINLSQPRSQLLWGGLLLAYFLLLRRSEYLHLGRRHHTYVLLGNVSFHDAGGNPCSSPKAKIVGVTLHGVKNNQFGREECRYHQKSGNRINCSVHAARWVMKGAAAFSTQKHQSALLTGGGTGIAAKELV
ncbi:hypothetical protein BBJ28_00008356 [Nothophytophthora sp. Chile5]|nr:hypothetical protein BBJ28_00008356 [Nothophytophthora sp. Chile5]